MDERALLIARGWTELPDGRWRAPFGGSSTGAIIESQSAHLVRRYFDAEEARAHGSVTYRPTAEQAQTSPLCVALAARGLMERDIIAAQHERIRRLEAMVQRLAECQPIGAIVIDGKRFVNPTADKMAADMHAERLASYANDPVWLDAMKAPK